MKTKRNLVEKQYSDLVAKPNTGNKAVVFEQAGN
jgi:hypothetical protein